jgi:Fe-S cluster assembly iron-binding protein IscA
MLEITLGADEALTHIRENIDGLPDDAGIRITQEPDEDGTPGFALEVVEAPQDDDSIIEGHPLRVFVAVDALDELEGSALDGEVHGDHVHFGFVDAETGETEFGNPDAVADDEPASRDGRPPAGDDAA